MRRPPMRWRFALLFLASSVAACQALFSFDGYAGGTADADAPLDARPPRADATTDAHDAGRPKSDALADQHAATDGGRDAAGDGCAIEASCGACGHTCLGGACVDGGCEPFTLDEGTAHGAFDLALDEASVYWTDNVAWSVNYVRKDGTSKGSLTGGTAEYVTGVATSAGRVYFASNVGSVASCPADGGCGGANANETFVIENSGDLRGVAASGTSVYWADETIDGGFSSIVGGDVDGGPFRALQTYPAHELQQFPKADDASVYWAQDDKVFSCPLAGCAGSVVTLIRGAPYPHEVVASAPALYFTTVTTGSSTLEYCGTPGGCASPLTLYASTTDTFGGVAIDSTYVYWTSYPTADAGTSGAPGAILRCPRSATSTCSPTVLAKNEYRPDHIAVDDAAIYWADTSLDPSTTTMPIRMLAK